MADVRVKYVADAGPWSEVGITGKQQSWRRNDVGFVPSTDAELLMASGKFALASSIDSVEQDDREIHAAEHAAMGNPLWKCGIPFILFAGDGSANGLIFNGAASGAFTLSAAVMANFIPPKFYAYLPADQAYSGSAAGWYYGTMSTTTAGVLYANTYDPTTGVIPTVPTSLTTLPVTKLTRLTQTTSEITALQVTANPIGANGLITETIKAVGTATAGAKMLSCRIGATLMFSIGWTSSGVVMEGSFSIQNSGSEVEQVVTKNHTLIGNAGATSLGGNEFKAVDLSAPFLFKNTMQIAANTESFAIWARSINVT